MDRIKKDLGVKQPVRRAVYSQDLTPHDRWGILRSVFVHGKGRLLPIEHSGHKKMRKFRFIKK